jgi:predicted CxxxxCH...CXXCH cytochrome family protein
VAVNDTPTSSPGGEARRQPSLAAAALLALAILATACGTSTRLSALPLASCDACHGTPPGGAHPQVASDLRYCSACHPGTVDASGLIIPGGLHRDGIVEYSFGGHDAGYAAPSVHGRDFFAAVAAAGPGGAVRCAACHGTDYASPIAAGRSCNGCHAAAGWGTAAAPGWLTNCSFCHGARTATTQAGYAVAEHPTWAAPPDAVSQRLGGAADASRTGAHAVHLTGSAVAGPVPCSACHAVPTTVAHVSGRDERARVALTAPGQAALPDPDAYDTTTRSCATACHGASRSPAWTFTGIACDGCHAVPPATPAHSGVSGSDLTACSACHPDTITGAGAVDVAGGRHVNGMVDLARHPDGFGAPAVHGPRFLDDLAGVPGALHCQGCHGADYGTPLGASQVTCNGCHAAAGWGTAGSASWQTNCSFCHGARNPTTQAGYSFAASPAYAAPPDAVSQRLTGTAAPTKTGAHQVHLIGKTGAAGAYPPFPCAGCHPVPTGLSHVSATRQATVVLDPVQLFTGLTTAQLAALPSPIAVYDASGTTPTCRNNYCHGATLSGRAATTAQYPPQWSTSAPAIGAAATDCTTCHGYPPPSGAHFSHVGEAVCTDCHYGAPHVNGRKDIAIVPYLSGTWDPVARTCNSGCHGTYYTWP